MSTQEFYADTNLLVRFLTNDDPVQSPIALEIFKEVVNGNVTLILTSHIVAECCWVLESTRYQYTPKEIAAKLSQIIESPGIKADEKEIILSSLEAYQSFNVDFIDAYLSILASKNKKSVLTWNKKHFKRLPGEFYLPEQVLSRD
jgi:predicted nucleic-acid-binding protein